MKKDLVSIVIPIYNSEKYLFECVQSIINQTYKDIEIFLINDGSSDKSDTICNQFLHDTRIKYIKKEKIEKKKQNGVRYIKNPCPSGAIAVALNIENP